MDVDLTRPLLPGVFLPCPNLSDLWISLNYEKLSVVCYNCGIIGHEASHCQDNVFRLTTLAGAHYIAVGQWLRAESEDIPMGVSNTGNESSLISKLVTVPTSTTPAPVGPCQSSPKHNASHTMNTYHNPPKTGSGKLVQGKKDLGERMSLEKDRCSALVDSNIVPALTNTGPSDLFIVMNSDTIMESKLGLYVNEPVQESLEGLLNTL